MRFLVRVLINAAAVAVATWLVDGIAVGGETTSVQALTLLGVGAILGLVNAVVRPVVRLLALPLFILTLGLITFVINALMLMLTTSIADLLDLDFTVDGFWSALIGALIISIVSLALSVLVRDD